MCEMRTLKGKTKAQLAPTKRCKHFEAGWVLPQGPNLSANVRLVETWRQEDKRSLGLGKTGREVLSIFDYRKDIRPRSRTATITCCEFKWQSLGAQNRNPRKATLTDPLDLRLLQSELAMATLETSHLLARLCEEKAYEGSTKTQVVF